jgi:hypothetical protein
MHGRKQEGRRPALKGALTLAGIVYRLY